MHAKNPYIVKPLAAAALLYIADAKSRYGQ